MTKRLDKLLSLVPRCELLADVGCDHGYLGIGALREKAKRVLFVDVSAPSLAKARASCPQELLSRAQFVCANGLGDYRVDCAVIAGMGGMEIISILKNAKFPPPSVVLQPNRNAAEVRRYLAESYRIELDEMMCEGGIFYNMIVAERCDEPCALTELETEFGKTNLQSPSGDFRLYLDREQAKLSKILSGCGDAAVEARLLLVRQALCAIGGQNDTK